MSFEAQSERKESECRALVPLETADRQHSGRPRAEAPFLVQLSANVNGFAQYRAKRREQPEVGASVYRTTISAALAVQPRGKKLDYCA
ncbi:MAG TPA: hypothetical protein PL193_09870 [Xanthobacteraceae bacterium]|nr:hypothetical protein [Xanthobacteraceae bacterium]